MGERLNVFLLWATGSAFVADFLMILWMMMNYEF